ncbi:MAG: fatty acid desaturase family protein [Flavobacteriales bacterium]
MKLRFLSDCRSLAFLGAYYAVFFLGWFWFLGQFEFYNLAFFPPKHAPWLLGVVVLLCVINFMVAITIHNSVHCPVFVGRNWNRAHRILLTLAFGAPASGYVPGHNLSHHKHLQTAKDNTRTYKMRFRWNLLNQMLFFFVMIPGILRTEGRFAKEIGPSKPNWYNQYRVEVWLSWIWKILFIAWNWKLAVWLLIIPNVYAVWGIFGTNFWQHDGCDENHPYNHSRNFTGKLFNFLVCNNGYHGAHHMRPALHWSLYPAYHREHIAPHLHPNLDQKSLLVYLWKSMIWPGRRVDYLGKPLPVPPKMQDQDWVFEARNTDLQAEDMGQAPS